LGPGQRLSLYRFQHHLFQRYLYNDLGEAERAYLHEDVGTVLEELYGDQADEVCVQLARHFVEAGIADKAATYLRRAGEQAAARFANDEALIYLGQALDLTPGSDVAARYAILLARERVYDVRGEREAQRQDLANLESLAARLGDPSTSRRGELVEPSGQAAQQAEVALRQANLAEVTGDYPAAVVAAQTTVRLAQTIPDVGHEAAGCLHWGRALWRQGDFEAARPQLERALTLARDAGLRQWELIEDMPQATSLATATDGERVVVYVGTPGGVVQIDQDDVLRGAGVYRWTSRLPTARLYLPLVCKECAP